MQIFANKSLFSPNFRKLFFGGFGEFQWVKAKKKAFFDEGAVFQILSPHKGQKNKDGTVNSARTRRISGSHFDLHNF